MTRRLIALAALGVLLSGGCTRYDVRLTAYRADERRWLADDAALAVVVESEPREPLLEREIRRKVAGWLASQGYRTVSATNINAATAPDSGATAVLEVFCTVDGGTARQRLDRYDVPEMRRSTIYSRRGRVVYRRTYYTRRTEYRLRTETLYGHGLDLTLYGAPLPPPNADAATIDAALLWRARADTIVRSADLRRMVDYLLVAGLERFGTDTGREIEVTFAADDERVAALRGESDD